MLGRFRALLATTAPRAWREEALVGVLGAAFGLAPVALGLLWLGGRPDLGASFASLARDGAIALGLIVIALLLTAATFSSTIKPRAAPKNALNDFSDELARITREGDFSARIPMAPGSETAQVAAGVNALLSAMEARESRLQADLSEISSLRDRAEATNRAKSSFLANMTHELRTPLNAIMGYAGMLREDAQLSGHDTAAGDLERILRAARHLLSLINDVLDLSRIEAGRIQLEYRPTSIRQLVEEALNAVGSAKGRGENAFKLNDACGDASMVTDTTKVRQCLINLLSNAFKFTSEGVVTMEIALRPTPLGEQVVFSVSDTGIGISEAQIERLFESFAQADASITRRFGGSGLGLAITRKLANLLGGDVSVASREGHGSTFTLVLPREPTASSAFRAVASNAIEASSAPGQRDALIIDDDPAAIDLMKRWLTRLGYSVISAPDGEAGFALARSSRPQLILLDIHMPQRTGWEILDRLKTDRATTDIPVIIVSVDDDRKRGIGAGASEFITKPACPEHLARVVDIYGAKSSGRILVVDDDRDAGNLVERAMRQVGFEVLRAFDGDEGLALARSQQPSAIVLDLSMPGKDGFAVLAALGADPLLQNIPVIVVSARSLTDVEFQHLARAGCAFHPKGIASPFEIASNVVTAVNG